MRFNRVKLQIRGKESFVMVGRKRKQGKRERNGRIQREKSPDPKVIALVQPHRQSVPADKRHDQRAENPFGRLNLINAVPDLEYDAGIKYRDIYLRYRATIDCPSPHPRAISMDGLVYGAGREIYPDESKRRNLDYRRSFEAIEGHRVRVVIKSVVIYEKELEPGDLPYLRMGLSNLVTHYGLTR